MTAGTALVRRLALASLVANVAIVVTGGAVRLTGSGLGCPTWPSCTGTSYVTTREMGAHGVIEFGNRMLGGLVGLVAIAALVAVLAARHRRPGAVRLAALVLVGVLAQGVLGGITVLTGLNPWTVAAHFLLSMAVIALAYALWRRVGPPPATEDAAPTGVARVLAGAVAAVAVVVLVLGTLVTGAGPHAGDPDTPRMGFDLVIVAQLHTDAVFLLVGLTVATWLALRAGPAPSAAGRAAGVLLLVELAQGGIGFVQYFTHLPVLLVGLHMAGACAVWLATLALLWESRPWRAPGLPATRAAEPVKPSVTISA